MTAVEVAAVHAASVLADRDATTAKGGGLTRRAGGAQKGHPGGFDAPALAVHPQVRGGSRRRCHRGPAAEPAKLQLGLAG